MSESFVTIDL